VKYVVLTSAVLMQMCLGATYSWSVYVQPLKALSGLQQGPVQIPFTVFYFIFPLSMLIAGNVLSKVGTRRSAMIGGLLFGGGWIVASFGSHSFLFTILGIGVLSGIGAGMAYIVPIAVCIRWFPKNKGLVTGVAVAGFGGGAALVSQVGGWCMETLQFTPYDTFLLLGSVFLLTVFTAGSTMKVPSHSSAMQVLKTLKIREVLGSPTFHLLYLAMFTGLAAGFAVNANLKEMFVGSGDLVRVGVVAVSLFALANAAGRVVWGTIFDRIMSRSAIQLNLYLQALTLVCAPLLLDSATGFYAVALLTGFNYGGVLVIYVSSASRIWGGENVGQIYGWLFSSNIPASLAPLLAGAVYDRYQNFDLVFNVLAALLVCGGVLVGLQSRRVTSEVSSSVV
jgi:MFS transporter, OFA family, oxalate/formate antiporter